MNLIRTMTGTCDACREKRMELIQYNGAWLCRDCQNSHKVIALIDELASLPDGHPRVKEILLKLV